MIMRFTCKNMFFYISDYSNMITYEEAISIWHSNFWLDAMKDEIKSMASNGVGDLDELLYGGKPIACKWVFKTKRDFNDQVERYKTRLVAKGFSQKEGIDYSYPQRILLESLWRLWRIMT